MVPGEEGRGFLGHPVSYLVWLVKYHIPPWQTITTLRIIADRLTAFCDDAFLFDRQADEISFS